MWRGIMAPVVSSAPSPRYLCLVVPYLPTDRFLRQKLGRAWRSAARPEAPDRSGERGQRQPRYDGGEPLSSYARPFSAGPSFAISPARGERELAGPDSHPPDDDRAAWPLNVDAPLAVVAKIKSALRLV